MHLAQVFTGGLTWRQLAVYIRGLPMESATKTILRDLQGDVPEIISEPDGYGSWSKTDLLLATLCDLVNSLIFVQVSRAGVKATAPVPIRRPGVAGTSKPKLTPQGVTYLDDIRRRNREARGEPA